MLALVSKILHPQRAEVVDLQSVQKWIVEVNTSCCVQDNLDFFCESEAVLRFETKTRQHEVTFNGYDLAIKPRIELRSFPEQRFEHFCLEDLLFYALS